MDNMNGKVFDRIEKKYLITKDDKKQLLKVIKKHMKKDDYHKSEVYNVYFDTDNYDLIVQSIDQPLFKHKLRARSYKGYDRVFLEIKTKIRGKDLNPGYKRRIMLTHDEYNVLVKNKITVEQLAMQKSDSRYERQIAKEIDHLVNHHHLKPKIMTIYNRESYKGEDNLRITFDENLRYRDDNLSLIKANHDKIYFKDKNNIIMEIKAHGVLPLWLVESLSKRKLYPQQFSKVGKSYEKIRKEQNV